MSIRVAAALSQFRKYIEIRILGAAAVALANLSAAAGAYRSVMLRPRKRIG